STGSLTARTVQVRPGLSAVVTDMTVASVTCSARSGLGDRARARRRCVPRECGGDGRGAHDRARDRRGARLALRADRRRRGGAGVPRRLVAALGPAWRLLPVEPLRLLVGALLLTFGLQWLRKAILRASGYRPLRDENAAFRREREQAAAAGVFQRAGLDWYAVTLAFKGVLLEGLEVALIVISFGSGQGRLALAAAGAGAAFLAVAAAGALVGAPLARVPENTIKLVVGMMLTSFGLFWAAEGAGAHWPGEDAALPGVLAFVVALSFAAVVLMRR